jgi:signal transduction histidine kinase
MPPLGLTARRLAFLLSGLPLGVAWFSLLVSAWSTTLGLAVTPLVVALFYVDGALIFAAAGVEAWLAREALGARALAPRWPPRRERWWGWVLGPVAAPSFWRAQAYLWLRASLGFAFGVALVALIGAGLGLIAAPLYAGTVSGGLHYGVYTAHDFAEALPGVPVGFLLLAATIMLAEPMTRPFSATSERLFGEDGVTPGAAARADQPSPSAARGAGLALATHAWVTALLFVVLTLIWAFAGGGSFWPLWAMLPLATVLAVHGWTRLLRARPQLWQRGRVDHALALHAGVLAALCLFLVGVWAGAGGGYFWPAWPILGLVTVLALHSGVVLLRSPDTRALSERIDVLETTRAGAVDAEGDRLRTIERDLHDGAQARLVALGMSLGMAEQKLAEAEPGEAQELLAEARVGAEEALRELRDLARGIHPPVLTDRGLEPAVRSLADLSPLRVAVSFELGAERPPSAIESALYFVAAEALANAAKHAHADSVDVRLRRAGGSLRLDVIDDGVGGADPNGHGLAGLRGRVLALDGELTVTSPRGGPTIVHAELPCA